MSKQNQKEKEQKDKKEKTKQSPDIAKPNIFSITKSHLIQVNPHFSLIYNDLDALSNEIYSNQKKCYILKSSIQQSQNFLKEQSNQLIKDIITQIYDLQAAYTSTSSGIGKQYSDIKNDVAKWEDEQKKIKDNVDVCTLRVHHCENEIGYHLLGRGTMNEWRAHYKEIEDHKGKSQK